MKILIINGPNLNMLGRREPEIYGKETFEDILSELSTRFQGIEILYFQSNHEGDIVSRIQETLDENLAGLVLNMGAYTHYSYAIFDALNMVKALKVEVHLSHLYSREPFRHKSVISPACQGMISGLGKMGYRMAIEWIVEKNAL
ncbi:MAG: type II 3-dehydroquinate dehydratase [Bacteroidia bacterium]|nr:type II 3-dehydroquinate dehydratase [Bacteroidia bacterium]